MKPILGNRLILSFLGSAVLLGILLTAFSPVFETDDDYYVSMIPQGIVIAPTPSSDLVLSSPVIGIVLKMLYGWFPEAPIYALYLLGALFVANASLLFVWCERGIKDAKFAIGFMVLLGTSAYLVQMLQFTAIALWLGFAGFSLFGCRSRQSTSRLHITDVVAILLLIACYLIRKDCLILTLIVWLPVLAVDSFKNQLPMRRWVSLLAVFSLFFVLIFAFERSRVNSDPRVVTHRNFISQIVKIADFSAYPSDPNVLKKGLEQAGLSSNDFEMIKLFFWSDETVYREDNLNLLGKTTLLSVSPFQNITVLGSLAEMRSWLFRGEIRIALVLMVLLLSLLKFPRSERFICLTGIMTTIGVLCFLLSCNRLPPRIYIPVVSGMSVMMLHFGTLRPFSKWARNILIIVVVIAVGKFIWGMHGKFLQHLALAQRVENTMGQFTPRPKDDELYVVWMAPLPSQGVLTLANLKNLLKGMHIAAWSWPQRTSSYYEMLDKFRITNVVKSLYERQDVYLVTLPHLIPYLTKFIKEHYGKTVRMKPHVQLDLLNIFKVEVVGD